MSLSTTQKNYIATHFGRGNCYASGGISFTDPTGTPQTGSTMDVVSTLEEDRGGFTEAEGPGGETWGSIPNSASISPSDVMGIGGSTYCVSSSAPPASSVQCTPGDTKCIGSSVYRCNYNDGWDLVQRCTNGCSNGECLPDSSTTPPPSSTGGCTLGYRRCNGRAVEECVRLSSGENVWRYLHTCDIGCVGAGVCTTATSTQEPGSQDTTGPFEVIVGGETGTSCDAGDPSVTLDTSGAYAYYKSEPTTYVGVMDIKVTNHNNEDCYAYFAWEMRMWDGHGYSTCPSHNPEVIEISRFLATVGDTKDITLKKVLANATEAIGGSFEIPASAEGKKTVCLTLWGNYSYSALVDELADAGYTQSIPW